jgi:SAM-dependent methyltransferase
MSVFTPRSLARVAPLTKRVAERALPQGLWRRMRDTKQRLAAKFVDRSLRRDVAALKAARDPSVPLRDDLELLLTLHERFSSRQFISSYDPDVILRTARDRFDWLRRHGVDLAGKDIVDYGAGHAAMLFVAHEFGVRRMVAVNYDDGAFRQVVARRGEPTVDHAFICADLTTYDPPAEAFDVCLCDNSFEHFAESAAVLDSCHKTLRSGGALCARFNPIFHSALGAHRYGFTGVPYVQNVFSREANWRFFQDHLNISGGRNMYTGELVPDGNPFPEMNGWRPAQYEALFLDATRWEPLYWQRQHDRRFAWFVDLFQEAAPELSEDEWFVSGYEFLLRRK